MEPNQPTKEDDPNEPTTADREAAEKILKPFCLHASVDLVEYVALGIKAERTRVTALFTKRVSKLEIAAQSAMKKADDHRRQRDELKSELSKCRDQILESQSEACRQCSRADALETQLKDWHDELNFDAARAESAELERDRAKAEAQRAEQDLNKLKIALLMSNVESTEIEASRTKVYGPSSYVAQVMIEYIDRVQNTLKEIG